MNWVIGKKQKRRNRIKAQFGKNPMELEAWESLEKRMREIRMYEELVVQGVKKEEWQRAGSVDTVTWNDLEMDICTDQPYPDVYGRADSVPSPAQYADTAVL